MLNCQQTIIQGPSEITKDGDKVETHHHFFSIKPQATFPKVCFRSSNMKNIQQFKSILPPTTAFIAMPPSFPSSSFALILHTLYHFDDFLKELEESYEKADFQVILFDFEEHPHSPQVETLLGMISHLRIPDNCFLIFRNNTDKTDGLAPTTKRTYEKGTFMFESSTPIDNIHRALTTSHIPTFPLARLGEGLYLEIEDCETTPKKLIKTHVHGRFFYPHPITNHTHVTFEWVATKPTPVTLKPLIEPTVPYITHAPNIHSNLQDLVARWIEDEHANDAFHLTSIMTHLTNVTKPTHLMYKSMHQKIKDDIARHTAFHKALQTLADYVDTSSFAIPTAVTTQTSHDSSTQLMAILNMCQTILSHQTALRERHDRNAQEKLLKGQTIFDSAFTIINAFDTPKLPQPPHLSRQFSFFPPPFHSTSPLLMPSKPPTLQYTPHK